MDTFGLDVLKIILNQLDFFFKQNKINADKQIL